MTTQQQDIEARRTTVASMMLARRSQRYMARELAVSVGTIVNDQRAVRAEWLERRYQDTEHWRAEEVARLDVVLAAIWERVLEGVLPAIDRFLLIMDRRARYLGLDQPLQIDVREKLEAYALQRAEQRGMDPEKAVKAVEAILMAARK